MVGAQAVLSARLVLCKTGDDGTRVPSLLIEVDGNEGFQTLCACPVPFVLRTSGVFVLAEGSTPF